jgi:hypothetical protein
LLISVNKKASGLTNIDKSEDPNLIKYWIATDIVQPFIWHIVKIIYHQSGTIENIIENTDIAFKAMFAALYKPVQRLIEIERNWVTSWGFLRPDAPAISVHIVYTRMCGDRKNCNDIPPSIVKELICG